MNYVERHLPRRYAGVREPLLRLDDYLDEVPVPSGLDLVA